MELAADTTMLATLLLVSLRFGAVFLLSPLFSLGQVPRQFKLLFLLALSFLMMLSLHISPVAAPLGLGDLMLAAASELLLGALLAFGVFAAFGAFLFGGRLLDFQMGFAVANLIDPSTHTQTPLMGTVLNSAAVLTFFLLDGHHLLIRGLAYSLEAVPPGSLLQGFDVSAVAAQFGLMFVYGLALVAPAVITLLLLDVGMAVAARTMPQVNMFIVGIPLKIFAGLLVLALSLNYMAPLLERLYGSIFHFWQTVLD